MSVSPLITRSKIAQNIKDGVVVTVDNLDDVITCIYASAKLPNLELFQAYVKQLDELTPVDTDLSSFWNNALQPAGEGGDNDIINIIFERGATKLFYGALGVAKNGSIELLQRFIDLGLDNLSEVSLEACIQGHTNMVKFILDNFGEEYGVDVNEMFLHSCPSGNMELVKYLHEKKTSNDGYGWAMQGAAASGNLDLLIWLNEINPDKEENSNLGQIVNDMENRLNNSGFNLGDPIEKILSLILTVPESFVSLGGRWNAIMSEAAKFNHPNIIQYCIDKGANDFVRAIPFASKNGYIDTVKWLIELAGNITHDWEHYLSFTISGEHIELAKFYANMILDTTNQDALLKLFFDNKRINVHVDIDRRFLINLLQEFHFSNWNGLLFAAARRRDLTLAKLAVSQGAKDFHTALTFAAPDDDHMREYLLDMMLV